MRFDLTLQTGNPRLKRLSMIEKNLKNTEVLPSDMKVLMNHIYEFKKGVRQMVLFTFNKRFEKYAVNRLRRQNICYMLQPVGNSRINLFFGKKECLDAIRLMITRPLNQLSPEEDFILGTMLGYDLCAQCERYCERKGRVALHNHNLSSSSKNGESL